MEKIWVRTGETYILKIDKLVYQGWGLGEIDGFKVFVEGTLPGDEVEVVITKKKRRFAHGKRRKLITHSTHRKDSPCEHYPSCGGCQFIDVPYETQLEFKQSILEDCVRQFIPNMSAPILPIIAAPSSTFYRNKMEFAFAGTDKNIYSGLKKRGKFDEVIQTHTCHLQSELSNNIRKVVDTYFQENPLTTWDYHEHNGVLRYLMVRHSKTLNEVMLNFIVSEDCKEHLAPLVKKINAKFKEVVSIFMSINPHNGDTAFTPESILLAGKDHIEEQFDDILFKISPQSFFQTNSLQGKVLYDTIVSLAEFKKTDLVFDLYSGTGTIGFYMAKHVGKVIGIEENVSAVEDAKQNAIRNKIENIEFIANRVKNELKYTKLKPDVIILDPPRSGTVPKALRRILDCKAPQVIYVSCNPVTLMRDLIEFQNAGYRIKVFQGVDMFPNTFHVEVVVKLELITDDKQ